MMKFIKLNFVALLVFAITFSGDANSSQEDKIQFDVDIAYKYMCEIEPDFSKMPDNLVKVYNENIKQIVTDCKKQKKKVRDRDKEMFRDAIDFTGLSFEQKIANLVNLHQSAVDNQLYNTDQTGNRMNMPDSDAEEEVCGYYTKIKMANRAYFNDSLCYNGSETSRQPGDNQIRQTYWKVCDGEAKTRKSRIISNPARVSFSINSVSCLQTNIQLRELLLANEVARRKIVDGIKKDEFFDLPIFCAITMAKKLLSDKKIKEQDFWVTGEQFHIFGDTVDNAFNKECLEQVIKYDWIIEKQKDEKKQAILNEKTTKRIKTIVNWDPINKAVTNAMKPTIDQEVHKLVTDKKKKERIEHIKKIIETYNEEYNKEKTFQSFKNKVETLIPQAFKRKVKVQIQDVKEEVEAEFQELEDEQRKEEEWYKYEEENYPIPGIHTNEGHHTESDHSDNSFGVGSEFEESTEEY